MLPLYPSLAHRGTVVLRMVETVHVHSNSFTPLHVLRNAMRYQPHTWDRNHHVVEQGRWLVRVYEWCIHRYVVRVYHRIEQTHISPLIEQRRIHSTSTPQARLPLINFSRKIFRKKIVGFKTHFSLFLRKMSRKKTRQAGFTAANHRFRPQNTVKNPMPAICARQEPLRGPAALGAEGLHPGGAQAELQRPCGWVGVTAAVGQ